MIVVPETITELCRRVESIAGMTVAQVAAQHGLAMPQNLRNHKGWFGHLIEKVLGADASSKPMPDFSALGIELKTLPLNQRGLAAESTFVSSISLTQLTGQTWQTSSVKKKLAHVLWLPIEGVKTIPLGQRRIGQGFLWQPSKEQAQQLENDWLELTNLIALGEIEQISAHLGEYLQVRPKAASGKSLTNGFNEQGQLAKTLPRGFYLRSCFTNQLLQQSFTNHAINLTEQF